VRHQLGQRTRHQQVVLRLVANLKDVLADNFFRMLDNWKRQPGRLVCLSFTTVERYNRRVRQAEETLSGKRQAQAYTR
jgi:hypothetical protein